MIQRECTEDEAARWRHDYSEGYRVARGDVRWNKPPRVDLVPIPDEVPFETGAQYVARHVGRAWLIGYARAWRYEAERRVSLV